MRTATLKVSGDRKEEYFHVALFSYLICHLPVFHLHDITDETISSTTLYEVPLSCEEFFRGGLTKFLNRKFVKIVKKGTL